MAVYWPFSTEGMDPQQITLAELLRERGYATALIGKWLLVHEPAYGPLAQGFERFYGLPYSNDMIPLPLIDQDEIVTTLTLDDQAELTALYTEQILAFIDDHADTPFFIYHATHVPHVPLAPGPAFAGTLPSCDELGATQACGSYAEQCTSMASCCSISTRIRGSSMISRPWSRSAWRSCARRCWRADF